MSAYLLFCADKRAENKDKKLSAKELGQMYGDLPDNKKDEYKKRYEDAVKKYEKELAAFNEKNTESEEESEPKKENKKKKAKTSKADQKKNNKKACNCGKCDECKKNKKKADEEDDDEDSDE